MAGRVKDAETVCLDRNCPIVEGCLLQLLDASSLESRRKDQRASVYRLQ